MSYPLEDYALIGDTETVALVRRDGSIDWLCLPRFDHGACFAALLGDAEHGHWHLRPSQEAETRRRYRPGTLVLETEFTTADGTVRLIDFMPPRGDLERGLNPDLVRIVEGVDGAVEMRMDLVIRFDYGSIVPWVTRGEGGALNAVAGPDALVLTTPVELRGEDRATRATFTVEAGERVPFVLTYHLSHRPAPDPVDASQALETTTGWWEDWTGRSTYDGDWAEAVQRSLITLKALTYRPTGAILAAATTSLPEDLGGERNWDYRYAWLRDATFTLLSLNVAGYRDEAASWRDWLLRAVAGDPEDVRIMYGLAGERRLTEIELDWLPGYEGSRPVRVGNAASTQVQIDVYGEIMDAMHGARQAGMEPEPEAWEMQRAFLDHLEDVWDEPDHGLWEIRGERQHFVHSRMMAWVAFDRGVSSVEQHGLDGPVDRWRELCETIHAEVCERGYDPQRNTFTQVYGGRALDASLLMMPQTGFLPPDDPRVVGTVEAIERELTVDGCFVLRYGHDAADDGLSGGEGAFLLCSFWLVDALAMIGRVDDARANFERLLAIGSDLGLLAEEYDPSTSRLVGNYPQAFSHVGLVNSARNLSRIAGGPARDRSGARD